MIHLAAWTHVGLVRTANEDAIALPGVLLHGSPPAPVVTSLPFLVPHGVAGFVAVVDGMGGHAGGAEASRFVAHELSVAGGPVHDVLAAANGGLYDEMDRRPELRAMGATVAGFRISDAAIEAFNVGDARVYAHIDGYTSLVSVDDRTASGTGEITQSLGGTIRREGVAAHTATLDLSRSARLLACSDGLSEVVGFGDVQDALDAPEPGSSAARLIELALRAGAPDNVSVIVLDHPVG